MLAMTVLQRTQAAGRCRRNSHHVAGCVRAEDVAISTFFSSPSVVLRMPITLVPDLSHETWPRVEQDSKI